MLSLQHSSPVVRQLTRYSELKERKEISFTIASLRHDECLACHPNLHSCGSFHGAIDSAAKWHRAIILVCTIASDDVVLAFSLQRRLRWARSFSQWRSFYFSFPRSMTFIFYPSLYATVFQHNAVICPTRSSSFCLYRDHNSIWRSTECCFICWSEHKLFGSLQYVVRLPK